MKVTFIVNPESSSGRTKARFNRLEPEIQEAFPNAEILHTKEPGHGIMLTRAALESGANLVVAVGGDGTANEVANGFFDNRRLVSADAKLGILMSGTGADFRRSIGIPKDLRRALLRIKEGRTINIDVGVLKSQKSDGSLNERYFLNESSLGLSALAASLVKDLPGKQSRLSYVIAALRALRRSKSTTLRVIVDGKEMELKDVSLIAFANAGYFGGAMHIAPEASLTDGLADVVCISNINLWLMIKYVLRIYSGTHLGLREVTHFRASSLVVPNHNEILVEADGEPQGTLPATFEILKGVLPLVC